VVLDPLDRAGGNFKQHDDYVVTGKTEGIGRDRRAMRDGRDGLGCSGGSWLLFFALYSIEHSALDVGCYRDRRDGSDRRESSDLLGCGGGAWLLFVAFDCVERRASGVALLRLSGSGGQGAVGEK